MAEVDWEALVQAARSARSRAHAPYSRFQVGAALLSGDGRIFTGCNVENASYGLTVCAERHAVAAAVLAGASELRACVVVTGAAQPTTPCGACRQVLSEFAPPELVVRCLTEQGGQLEVRMDALLPYAFERASLS